jgi:selenocysteine-specific elongation factor
VNRFLVGTAGHIDHGKTALVKALTGIDADRLPEEKRRGITIDLGFAHAEWEGIRVSFVDVPGHERFVRNMLAGAGGIQAVLLVVAADESVMPQTREHFDIVRMLGLKRGVIALTKIDRASPEMIEVTRSDVHDLMRGSFLENAPMVAVSSRTGEGVEALRAAILEVARSEPAEDPEDRAARLPIDRAFLIAGFGPVVTGSLVSGTISRDQRLELLPERRVVRVRRLEVHGHEEEVAHAGERVSANLVGVALEDLHRGLVLAPPGAFPVSTRLLVRLDLLADAPPLSTGDAVSFHHFATELRARIRLLESPELPPGASARVQLRLSSPVASVPGDRFVLRRLSPVQTIGGGIVLDPSPAPARGRPGSAESEALDRLEHGTLSERLELWIAGSRERGADEEALARRAGAPASALRDALGPALEGRRIHALRRSPDRYISEPALAGIAARATGRLQALVAASTGALGAPRSTLLQRVLPGADPRWAEAIEAALVSRGVLVLSGDEARPPGREDIAAPDRDLSERIAAVFRDGGLDPPSPAEVAASVQRHAKVVDGLIGYLVKRGVLVRLPGGWILARDAVDAVAARVRGLEQPSLDVAEFKTLFGLTRRLAIPLLEHLDATKVTRRVGDRREILRSP